MKLLDTDIAPLGMGCWPIGGPFYNGDQPLGFADVNDAESLRTIHAAIDTGVRLFDAAAVYGAGHAERLLGQALKHQPDAIIISKLGMGFDEQTKRITGNETDPRDVLPAIERSLKRLQRDHVDIMLLHLNSLPLTEAEPIFEAMSRAREMGKIRAFGWSTDFPDSAQAMAQTDGFIGVEHAMNLFLDVPTMQNVVEKTGLSAFIRSPLAMGILSGKFDATSVMAPDDIRASNEEKRDYFRDAHVNPHYLAQLNAIRELLQTGGRSTPQGALCWIMAKSAQNIPVPGARTVSQMVDNAGAIAHGPLPANVMQEIEQLITREPEGEARAR